MQGSNSETDIQKGFDHGYQIAISLGYLISTIQMLSYGMVQKYNRIYPTVPSAIIAGSSTSLPSEDTTSSSTNDNNTIEIHNRILRNIQHIEILKKQLFQQLPESLYYPNSLTIPYSSSSVAIVSNSKSNSTTTIDTKNTVNSSLTNSSAPNNNADYSVDILRHIHSLLIPSETIITTDSTVCSTTNTLSSIPLLLPSSLPSSSSSSFPNTTTVDSLLLHPPSDTSSLGTVHSSDNPDPVKGSMVPTNILIQIAELQKFIKETMDLLRNVR